MTFRFTWTRKNDGAGNTILAGDINSLQAAVEAMQDVRTVTGAYTATSADETILADASGGAFTVTLPPAAGLVGKRFTIKRTSASNNVVVDGNGSETIDGAGTKSLNSQYAFISIACNGANWFIVASGGTIV
jgi:hypothetical protein